MTKNLIAVGGAVTLTAIGVSRKEYRAMADKSSDDCEVSPKETKGPFPNKAPADYAREHSIGNRKGVALLMTMTILNKNNECKPLSNAVVDVWHCDGQGNYSEYNMRSEDLTNKHFLRGRQTTDNNGRVSFISIFPGFYRGRAPHIHVEVLGVTNKSLLGTQIAFPDAICDSVYVTDNYQGTDYISNTRDGLFKDSLVQNLADSVTGNPKEGYTLLKNIVVDA